MEENQIQTSFEASEDFSTKPDFSDNFVENSSQQKSEISKETLEDGQSLCEDPSKELILGKF